MLFVHRALPDGDLYFVDNRTARAEDVEATFRVSGRQPELWRRPATAASRTVPATVEADRAAVSGPWQLRFQPDRGAPAGITLDTLTSWSDHADPGVKYFAGTGTYTATIQAPPGWFTPGARLWLDLGRVENIAEVSIGGTPLGVVWMPPLRVEVTRAA